MIDNNYLQDSNLNLKYFCNYKMILKNVNVNVIYLTYEDSAYVVVNFLSQLIFIFPLFWGMVMYVNEF